MAVIVDITAKDNGAVKAAVKLSSSSKERKESGKFIIEGARLCLDAAKSGACIDTVFFTEKAEKEYVDAVTALIDSAKTVYRVSEQIAEKISNTVSSQGVFAILEIPEKEQSRVNIKGKYLALENTQDPSNLGAISRTAEALGIDGIIVAVGGCDPYSPKAQRAGMGSLLRLPIIRTDNFIDEMKDLQAKGMKIYGSVIRDADSYLGDRPFEDGSVVMIGNEGNGLSDDAIALADERVTIRMKGRTESFNAATAAAIFLWEMTKEN